MISIRAIGTRGGQQELLWLTDPVECRFTPDQNAAHIFDSEAEASAVIHKMNAGFGYAAGDGFAAERFETWVAGLGGSE